MTQADGPHKENDTRNGHLVHILEQVRLEGTLEIIKL